MENLADFLFAKVVGECPVTRASCIEYWSADVDLCKSLPN